MHTLSRYSKEHGYVALMATIIIAAVLLVMSVEGSIAGWRARFNVLGTEAKEQASALAQGCADQALSAIMTDPSYTGNATTTTDVGTCHVFPIEFNFPIEGVVSIRTQAVVRGSYANLEMQLNMSDIHIDSVPAAPTKGTIVVITNVVNDGEGTLHADDFTMRASGGNPTLTSFAGSESGVIVRVDPGAYSITADSASGYATTFSTNCTGSIDTGDIAFCTVINDDITTTLTVLVNVINDNGGTRAYDDFPVYIDGDSVVPGVARNVTSGSHTASADTIANYTASVWGYQCDNDGDVNVPEGQSKTCIINYNDNPPPSPSCAETVVMLDRSYSMFGYPDYPSGYTQWIPDEKTAAKSLIDLYSGVTPNPKMGIGRFGDVSTGRSAEIIHQLSTNYTAMKTAVDGGLPSNPISYTNLEAAISKAREELNSSRHTAGKEKVIIMVSDGEPNEPSGVSTFDTGFLSPTVGVQESVTSLWSNPANAYADGAGDASGVVTGGNNRERYYSFNIRGGAGLPSGASVSGIQIKADAWATAPAASAPGSVSETPSQGVSPNQWSSPTTNAVSSNNSYVTSNTNGNQQGFNGFGFSIPSNATITGVLVRTEAKISGSPTTVLTDSFGAGNPTDVPNWNENGSDTVVLAAGGGNDSVSPNGGSFARIDDNGGWICRTVNTSGISNLSIAYNWRGDSDAENFNPSGSDGGPDVGSVEYNTSGSADCNSSNGWTLVESHDLSIDNSWSTFSEALPSALDNDNSWTVRFRNPSVNGGGNPEYFRVDGVQITGTSGSGSGSLDVALSSNTGSTYTATKSVALTGTEANLTPSGNSTTDMWGRTWTPDDLNGNDFVVRLENKSATGNTVSLDVITVDVYYTTPVTAGTACRLGVDLSWNGGVAWTTEKTQDITNTETTYTLGSISDDWRSGSWAPGDFSNTNFRARVRAIDPDTGSGCDNSATAHLDWLQMNVRYTQNVDPQQAALNAADSAKLDGINLFTIHFGADPSGYAGKELLANLASGGTAVSGHQNGSYADPSSVTSGNTGSVSPTAQAAASGGDGNGYEITPAEAFGDGGDYARNMNGAGDKHIFSGYPLTIPPGATIVGIQTRLDWWLESTSGTNSMGVELSWNGGTSWTSAKTESTESLSQVTRTLGSSSDTWGHAWSASDLSPANFKVRVTSNCSGNANPSCSNRDFYLDWIPVTVYYTVNTENGDDDNFFVSPTSADMDNIFDFIGEEVCPAIGFAEAAEPPTTGSLTVITNVVGDTITPEDVSISVSPSSAAPNSFDGSTAGTVVVLNPGSYTVQGTLPSEYADGYIEMAGAGCSSADTGNIIAGESRVCVLTYDDIPPPPPPPDLSIHLGSWKEVGTAE